MVVPSKECRARIPIVFVVAGNCCALGKIIKTNQDEKKKFVENKKNNIKYRVISEDSCDKNKVSLSDESKKSVNDDVNNLINIIGDDIIEYM